MAQNKEAASSEQRKAASKTNQDASIIPDSPAKEIPFHPIADIFPLMEETQGGRLPFSALVLNIKKNGLREPITLLDGKILDGRNRYRACLEAGVEPTFKKYDHGNGSPLEYVVSLNLHRRHLDESQRAMVAAKLATMRQGERTDLASNEAKLDQQKAAKMMKVSRSNVQRARKVLDSGNKKLITAVEQGEIAVSRAAKELSTPPATKLVPNKETRPCVGMMHAENAVRQLEKISPDDEEWESALIHVISWLEVKLEEITAKRQAKKRGRP
jgi:ParB-like chromosome segregation protein Spo0J